MAKLILIGKVAQVELTATEDEEAGIWLATCEKHEHWWDKRAVEPTLVGCGWTERYDTLNDAAEYASDHADRGV